MSNPHGRFTWYELLAGDTAAAGRFYGDVFGWTSSFFGGAVDGYQILSHGEQAVGGMMQAPPGVRPGWLGYIGVDDVDAAVAGITAAGGTLHMPARDLPNVGRIAMLSDPQGAPFYVMRGSSDQASHSYDPAAIGHCAWNELATSDLGAAEAFYVRQFGWRRGEALPMGAMGNYQLMLPAVGDDAPFAGMMARPGAAPPMWNFYFRVPLIGPAAQRLREAGGAVLHGPVEVPGGDHVVIATDPEGAVFGLTGKPA